MRARTIILSLAAGAGALATTGLGAMLAAAARERSAGEETRRALLEQNEALLSFANKVARGETPKEALEHLAVEGDVAPTAKGDLVVYGPLVVRTKDGAVEAICLAVAPPDHPCADFVEAREAPPSAADRNN